MVQKLRNPEKKNPAQHLYDVIFKDILAFLENRLLPNYIREVLLPIKRDLKDIKILIKTVRNKQIELENSYKSLGISLGQLGIVDINILNKTVDMIRDKLSVVGNNGQIVGKINIHRYNLIPVDKNILINPSSLPLQTP